MCAVSFGFTLLTLFVHSNGSQQTKIDSVDSMLKERRMDEVAKVKDKREKRKIILIEIADNEVFNGAISDH